MFGSKHQSGLAPIREKITDVRFLFHFYCLYLAGKFFLNVFVPHLLKLSYMIRHIATLCMSEDDAKADYVRHITEIKAYVPADKVMSKMFSRASCTSVRPRLQSVLQT